MARATFRIWRSMGAEGRFQDYSAEVSEGMVVGGAVGPKPAAAAPARAGPGDCKAAKVGSC